MEINNWLDEEWLTDDAEDDDMQGKYVVFRLNGQEYGIEIGCVREIVRIPKITEIPDMPSYVKGVINLRGKVFPVLDVRLRFGVPVRQYNDRTCVIVVMLRQQSIGLVVDQVLEILDIDMEYVEAVQRGQHCAENRYLQGVAKVKGKVKWLIDVEKLVFSKP